MNGNHITKWTEEVQVRMSEMGAELARVRARVAELEDENAKLRAAWPTFDPDARPWHQNNERTIGYDDEYEHKWYVTGDSTGEYPRRDDAINAAAGIAQPPTQATQSSSNTVPQGR